MKGGVGKAQAVSRHCIRQAVGLLRSTCEVSEQTRVTEEMEGRRQVKGNFFQGHIRRTQGRGNV